MAKKIEILENTLLKLLVRRGSNADREDVILSEGELGYTTDTNRLFVGDGVTPGGKIVGNRFLGTSNSVTTFANANVGDLAYDADDRALYAYAGPDPATSINGWTLISSVTDENTSNIKISVGNLDEGANNIAGEGIVINNGRLAIDCAGINTNKIAPCNNTAGALELPNTIQYGNNAAYSYSIPARTGSAGKFLVGDNNGNLSWSSDINVGSVTYFSTAEQVIPVGAIVAFADLDAVESNWLICNGDEYDKTTYPDLFDIIGYDYGGADPLFLVPDLRDKVLYGTEDKPTNQGDIELGSGGSGSGGGIVTSSPIPAADIKGGVRSRNHGLNSVPLMFGSRARCVQPNKGYAIGDEVILDTQVDGSHSSNVGRPVSTYADDTAVYFAGDASSGSVLTSYFVGEISNADGTSDEGLDSDSWEIILWWWDPTSSSSVQGNSAILNASFVQGNRPVAGVDVPAGDIALSTGYQIIDLNDVNSFKTGLTTNTVIVNNTGVFSNTNNISVQVAYAHHGQETNGGAIDQAICGIYQDNVNGDYTKIIVQCSNSPKDWSGKYDAYFNINAVQYTVGTSTGTAQATPTVYAIKAVTDPVVSSTLTVKSPLTASVDGVLQGENPFNSLEGDIEIGIGQSTISLDDIKMFNLKTKVGVSKGYIESNNSVNDIDTYYRGNLPVSFDSGVKFVELKYSSSIISTGSDEDGINGTIYIDWENKKLKQSSVLPDGGSYVHSHWYESTGAESNGVIMFNTSENQGSPAIGTLHLEGIVIDWDSKQINGLPHYNRDGGNSAAWAYEHQYIFRDLTNSGSFGSAGSGGGATTVDLFKREYLDTPVLVKETTNGTDVTETKDLNTLAGVTVPPWATRGIFLLGGTQSNINPGGTNIYINGNLYIVAFSGGGNGNDNNAVEITEKLTGSSISYEITDNGTDSLAKIILLGFEGNESTAIAGGSGGGSSLLKYGTIDVGDPGPITGGSIPTTGDFTTIDLGNDGANFYDIFECTFNSSLPNSNYNVVFELISNGSVNADNNMRYPIITEKTAAGFTFSIEEGTTATQDLEINVRIESNQANAVIADQKWEAVTDGTYDFDQASNLETSEFINSTGSPLVIRGQFDKLQVGAGGADDINIAAHITHVGETTHVSVPFAIEIGFQEPTGYATVVGNITIPAGATYKFVRTTTNYTNLYWFKMTTTAVVGSAVGSSSSSVAPSIIIKYADNASLGGGSASTWSTDPVVDIAVDGVAGVSVSPDNLTVILPNGTYRYAFIYTSTNTNSTYRTQLAIRAGARQLLTSNSWNYSGDASEQGTINVTSGGIVFEGMRYDSMANVYGAYLMLIPTADFTTQVSIEAARPELLGKIQ